MKYIFRFSIMLSIMAAPFFSQAQNGFTLSVAYTAAKPVGDFRNIVNEWSWRGWEGNLLYRINNRFSVGLATGMQDFRQKYDRTVIHQGGRDISAVVTNDIEVMPVMAKVKYDFTGGMIRPYMALAAGANFIKYDKYFGEFLSYDHVTKFAARPEVGLHIGFGNRFGVNVGGAFNYMPYRNEEVDGLHNLMLKAGVNIGLD